MDVPQEGGRASAGTSLAVYGLTHAIVDGVCAALAAHAVAGKVGTPYALWLWVVAYDTLAFGLQVPFGHLVDSLRALRAFAAAGCLLVGLASLTCGLSMPVSLCVAGLGNALFHAGGGAVSINATPHRATGPGLFVAPGWVGLTLGGLSASHGGFSPYLFAMLPLLACLALFVVGAPSTGDGRPPVRARDGRFVLALVLLLSAIAARSLLGLAENFPWKSDTALLLALACAVAGGKAAGGILADRFGWTRVSVAALLAAAPLVSFGAMRPAWAITGMFLFQMAMPVTLASVAALFPGRAGFAFGLASFALIAGAWPTFTALTSPLGDHIFLFVLALLSASAVFGGLLALRRLLSLRDANEPVLTRL